MANLETLTVRIRADIRSFAAGMAQVGSQASAMESRVEGAAESVDTLGGRLNSLGRYAKVAGVVLAGLATGGAAVAGAAMVGFSSRIEQAEIAFTNMLGSGRKARAFLEELEKFAQRTPFEFPELVDASKRLLAFGFEAKEIIPTMRAIGDASAALGGGAETIEGITMALGQMKASGRVSLEEIYQLTERGVPALQILADEFGVTTARMREMISEGTVPVGRALDALIEGMQDRFGGQMQKQSRTLAGAFSTMKDALLSVGSDALRPLYDQLTRGAVVVADFLSSADFSGFGEAASRGLSAAVDAVGRFVSAVRRSASGGFLGTIGSAFSSAFRAAREAIANAIEWIRNAFSGLWPYIRPALANIAQGIRALQPAIAPVAALVSGVLAGAFKALAPIIGTVLVVALNAAALAFRAIAEVIGFVGRMLRPFAPLIQKVGQVIGFVLGTLIGSSVSIAIRVLSRLFPVLGRLAPAFQQALAAGRSAFSALSSVFQMLFRQAVVVFNGTRRTVSVAWRAISAVTRTTWNAIRGVLGAVWRAISALVIRTTAAISARIRSSWGAIRAATAATWNAIRNFLSRVWDAISNLVSRAASGIRRRIASAWNAIRSATLSAWNFVRATIGDRIGAAWSVVRRVGGRLLEFIRSTWRAIREGTASAWAAISQAIWEPIRDAVDRVRGFINTVLDIVAKVLDTFGLDKMANTVRSAKFSGGGERVTGSGGRGGPHYKMMARGGVLEGDEGAVGTGQRIIAITNEAGPEAVIPLDRRTPEGVRAFEAAMRSPNARYALRRAHGGSRRQLGGLRHRPATTGSGGTRKNRGDGEVRGNGWTDSIWNYPPLSPWNNYVGRVAALVKKRFGSTPSTYAGHQPDMWHAIDFMTGGPNALGDRIAAFLTGNWRAIGLDYAIWKQRFWMPVPNKYGPAYQWNMMEDRGSPTQNHYDHVHASFRPEPGSGRVSGSGSGGVSSLASRVISALLRRLPDVPSFGDHILARGLSEYLSNYKDWIADWITRKLGGRSSGAGFSGGGTPAANRRLGRRMAREIKGWVGEQWTALDSLWTRESGWDHTATNPTSGAYGIPQALPPEKMASHGSDWRTNPATQIAWGLDYIQGRYGNPVGAWSFWQTHHWYDRGGIIPGPKGMPRILPAHSGERVLPIGLVDAFDRLAASIELWSRSRTASGAAPAVGESCQDEILRAVVDRLERIERKIASAEEIGDSIREGTYGLLGTARAIDTVDSGLGRKYEFVQKLKG